MSLALNPPLWYGGENFHVIKRGAPTHTNGPQKTKRPGKKQFQKPLDPNWRRCFAPRGFMVTRGVIDREQE